MTRRGARFALIACVAGLGSAAALPAEAEGDAVQTVRLEGSVRLRYEALANPFNAGQTDDEMLGVQTQVRAEYDLGDTGLTFGGELLDSRFLGGNETGRAGGEIDTLEPAQAWLAWRPNDLFLAGSNAELKVGRFTMDMGSRRLVARANYRSILSSFDGVRATWTAPDGVALMFAHVAPVSRRPSDSASALDNEVALNETQDNVRFSLAHLTAPLPFDADGEAYVLDLDEDDASDAATRNRDLLTWGLRLRRGPATSQVDFDLEYASQTGSVRATTAPTDLTSLDHDADMAHAEIGYTFDGPWSPRVSLMYDYASGDAAPTDGNSGRFDPLFGDRSFEFGPTSIFGFIARANLSSPAVRLEVRPGADSDALVMLRSIELDEARDSFANSGVRDVTGASGKDVGLMIDARYRHWLAPKTLRLSAGVTAILQGDFMETAPNATGLGDPLFTYTELTWAF